MHNYVRMLWGKRVIEWQRSYEMAFELLVHLNNKYALDGRDPNSYAGILWCFGKHDRPWFRTRDLRKAALYDLKKHGEEIPSKGLHSNGPLLLGSLKLERVLCQAIKSWVQ